MSMFAIQTPLALRIALQPQFSVFFFFAAVIFSQGAFISPFVCERKKKHRPFKYLFLNPSKNTNKGKKNLTYFGSVLFTPLFKA